MTKTPLVLDSTTSFEDNVDGSAIVRQQEIPTEFTDSLKRKKNALANERSGDFLHVAAVPVVIHEEWLRQGYDMTREPAHKTLQRLRTLGLDAFIVTNKRI